MYKVLYTDKSGKTHSVIFNTLEVAQRFAAKKLAMGYLVDIVYP